MKLKIASPRRFRPGIVRTADFASVGAAMSVSATTIASICSSCGVVGKGLFATSQGMIALRRSVVSLLMALAAACAAFAANAQIRLAAPFADNMVMQRCVPVPVWGTATPEEAVTVEFAGQLKTAKVDARGEWRVRLDPMEASCENRTMKVSVAGSHEEIVNVLVGEVWFASGQSNMECPIWGPSPCYRDG